MAEDFELAGAFNVSEDAMAVVIDVEAIAFAEVKDGSAFFGVQETNLASFGSSHVVHIL